MTISKYDSIEQHLAKLTEAGKKIGVDTKKCNSMLHSIIKPVAVEKNGIIEDLKALKTEIEREGMRRCNIKDCAAIVKYFAFLKHELKNPGHNLDEYSGARKVEEFRTHGELYQGPSFDTISSIGPNGAVIHYKPDKETALKLNNNEIYLLDSGGQYLEGTTDITRTAHFGGNPPTSF